MLRFLRIKHLAVIDAVEVEFEPGPQRPDRRDRRRQVHPRRSGRAAARRPRLGRPGPHGRGRRGDRSDLRERRRRAARPPRNHRAGPQPRVHQRRARHRRRAEGSVDRGSSSCTASTSIRRCSIRRRTSRVLDAFGRARRRSRRRSATAFDALRARRRTSSRRGTAPRRDRDARLELVAFQLGELDKAGAEEPGEDEELASLRQVLASAERVERLCAESYAALYDSDDASCGLGGVWRRVGELAALDPQFEPYLDARDGIKSQLEDLAAFPAQLRGRHRRLAGAAAAGRGAPRAARAAEAEARADARRRHRAARRAARASCADLRARRRAGRRARARARGGARRRILAAAGTLSTRAPARRERLCRRRSRALLAELAMERTRFEVRFNEEPLPEAAWTDRGHRRARSSSSRRIPAKTSGRWRGSSRAASCRASCSAIKTLTATTRHGFSDAADRPPSASAPGLIFDEVDAGIGGRVADVVGRKLRALGSAFQVLCITHLPQIAAYADTHFQIEKRVDGGRTRTTVRRLDDERPGRGARADARRRSDQRWPADSAREMLDGAVEAAGAESRRKRKGESRKAKGESERRKGESPDDGAEIPDRNVRLPDERPRLRADGRPARAGRLRGRPTTPPTPTSSSSTPAACASAPRRSCTRGSANCGSWPPNTGHDPIVAVAGCVAQQEGEAILKRSPGVADVIVGTQAIRRLPMLVEQAARAERRSPVIDLEPVRRRHVPARRDAARRSGQGVRHDHRRLQRVLQLLRRAVHARPRADAAEGRHPGRGARGGGDAATAKCSCSARSSITTRRPTTRRATSAACSRRSTRSTGIERIRFASPHPRHVSRAVPRRDARLPKVCRHLHLPVQSGSTRVLEAMRRRYTRESYLELVAQIRETLPDVALSTDMIVGFPGRDRRRLRRDAVADGGGAVSQHVLVQVLAAAEHAGRQAAAGRCARRGEDAADRGAAGAAAGHSVGAERGDWSGTTVDVLVDAASRRRDDGAVGPDEHERGRQSARAGATGSGGRCRSAIERAGPHSVWGRRRPCGRSTASRAGA